MKKLLTIYLASIKGIAKLFNDRLELSFEGLPSMNTLVLFDGDTMHIEKDLKNGENIIKFDGIQKLTPNFGGIFFDVQKRILGEFGGKLDDYFKKKLFEKIEKAEQKNDGRFKHETVLKTDPLSLEGNLDPKIALAVEKKTEPLKQAKPKPEPGEARNEPADFYIHNFAAMPHILVNPDMNVKTETSSKNAFEFEKEIKTIPVTVVKPFDYFNESSETSSHKPDVQFSQQKSEMNSKPDYHFDPLLQEDSTLADELPISEYNYFEEEIPFEISKKKEYFADLLALFETEQRFYELEDAIVNSKFVRIDFDDNKFYAVGAIFDKDELKYIVYGLPVENRNYSHKLKDIAEMIEIKPNMSFYFIYQDADTGEMLKNLKKSTNRAANKSKK